MHSEARRIKGDPVQMAAPHSPEQCEGKGCSWHHPSDHHMRQWPKTWRAYYGYFDRICPHGLGHPDPDDVLDLQSVGGVSTVHPCDGCCIAPLRPERQRGKELPHPADD